MSSNTKEYRVISLVYFGERLSAKAEKMLAQQLVASQVRMSPEDVNVSVIQADESDIALSTLVKAQPTTSITNPTDDVVQSAKLIGLMFEKEIGNTVALTIAMNAKVAATASNASDENVALIRALKEACKPNFIEKLGTNYSQYHIDEYVVNTIKQVLDFNGISHE